MGFNSHSSQPTATSSTASRLRVPDWSAGDTVIAAGNVHYRVVSVIPVELAAEFVDGPLNGVLEVEPV